MKFVVQRVKNAKVEVENKVVGKIDNGFLVLIGITHTDTKEIADYLIKKLVNLRVFEDDNGKLNLSLNDIKGSLLLVSQFTLYACCEHGNRPSFIKAAKPDKAKELSTEIKKIVDDKSKYTDWAKRDDIKAELKMDLILILAEYGYPPVTNDEVFKEIFEQAENFKKYN